MMSRFLFICIPLLCLLTFLVSKNIEAHARLRTQQVLSANGNENERPPAGYANCDMIKAGWVEAVWVPVHQECHYPTASEVKVWVSGYYGCTDSVHGKVCHHRVWYPSHFATHSLTEEAFYQREHQHVHFHD